MIGEWINRKPDVGPDEPLIRIVGKRTAEMLRKDLERARSVWIEDSRTHAEKQERERSSFLRYIDENGHYADFHALRMTFITNLSRADVSPKTAQTLARHSDINLTMNTYTMLSVHDQASAVEMLPPIPTGDQPEARQIRATGTDGLETSPWLVPTMVPTMVPKTVPSGSHRTRGRLRQIAPLSGKRGGNQ